MFLTTKGRYAVTAILDISLRNDEQKPISLAQIAERQSISISYLEQIFLLLKKKGIVRSVKGPGGGYILNKKPSEISVIEILHASGESIKMTKCEKGKTCVGSSKKCITHHLWQEFEENIANYLTKTTIQDIKNQNCSKINEISAPASNS